MSSIKAVIFDCFGVLAIDAGEMYVAKFPQHARELSDLGAACNRGYIDQDEYVRSVGELTGDSVERVRALLRQEHAVNEPLIEYTNANLKPKYRIGMLSNIGRGWINEVFEKQLLESMFDAIVLSGEEGIAKPDAEIYALAARRLGVEPHQCVMVDDREVNLFGAETAGMQTVLYGSYEQATKDLERVIQVS